MAKSDNMPEVIRNIILSITDKTGLAGGSAPKDERDFWSELCIYLNIQPSVDLIANAKSTFQSLGEVWDEDYVDEEGGLSISAYEALVVRLPSKQPEIDSTGSAKSDDEDDDDEAIGPLGMEFRSQAIKSDIPIETLMGWVRDGKLVLDPEWQRSFVWKPSKQRRLVESIFLGLPIPSFLLSENTKTGKFYVIDGRQRLETIDRFCAGKPRKGEKRRRFRTFSAKEEGWKKGELLNDAAGKFYDDLPPGFKTRIDGNPLVVFTFRDIPPDKLYQIFKRYNTGAVALNAAEIRNAVYQDSKLHQMMYRLAGEHDDPDKYKDAAERDAGERLKSIMGSKIQRYGAYDFIGRFLAFRHGRTGSVANATNAFMKAYQDSPDRLESLRQEFIEALSRTLTWYEYPLIEPEEDGSGRFHAFLATVQMVSTSRMLRHISDKLVTESAVRAAVESQWLRFTKGDPGPPLVVGILEPKQNSGLFWNSQNEWIARLEEASGVPVGKRTVSAP